MNLMLQLRNLSKKKWFVILKEKEEKYTNKQANKTAKKNNGIKTKTNNGTRCMCLIVITNNETKNDVNGKNWNVTLSIKCKQFEQFLIFIRSFKCVSLHIQNMCGVGWLDDEKHLIKTGQIRERERNIYLLC